MTRKVLFTLSAVFSITAFIIMYSYYWYMAGATKNLPRVSLSLIFLFLGFISSAAISHENYITRDYSIILLVVFTLPTVLLVILSLGPKVYFYDAQPYFIFSGLVLLVMSCISYGVSIFVGSEI